MNKAMSRVDELTQRNATAAEEVASTSEELASQAESLQQLISFFRLGRNGDGGDAAATGADKLPAVTRDTVASRPFVAAPVIARQSVTAADDAEFTRF
jgi:methyl-accepting chemotaxis protein